MTEKYRNELLVKIHETVDSFEFKAGQISAEDVGGALDTMRNDTISVYLESQKLTPEEAKIVESYINKVDPRRTNPQA